jgi:hypothetical protein
MNYLLLVPASLMWLSYHTILTKNFQQKSRTCAYWTLLLEIIVGG